MKAIRKDGSRRMVYEIAWRDGTPFWYNTTDRNDIALYPFATAFYNPNWKVIEEKRKKRKLSV